MRALITNDDGIDSEGIHVLARVVEQAGFEVTVIAPSYNASGTGASLGHLSAETPIPYEEREIPGLQGRAFSINGPPALCTISAHLEAFGPKPDLVVSGINAGLNTGRSVLHSGTVGAALAAQNFGMRGLAVSLDVSESWFWNSAAEVTRSVLPLVVNSPERCVLNLNIPALPTRDIKDIVWAGLAAFGSVKSHISDKNHGALYFDLIDADYEPPLDSDLGLVRAGFASITALHGTSEVWSNGLNAGYRLLPEHLIPSATSGHQLAPAQHFAKSNSSH